MTTIGTDSEYACATAPNAFSVPGPDCIVKTPMSLPERMRLNESVMCTPVRSWRTTRGRMSARATASNSGLIG